MTETPIKIPKWLSARVYNLNLVPVRRCNAVDSADTTKIIDGSIVGDSRFVW